MSHPVGHQSDGKTSSDAFDCRSVKPLLYAGGLSLSVIAAAAYTQNRLFAVFAAAAFASAVIAAGVDIKKTAGRDSNAHFGMLRNSVCLSVLTCAWSAAALFLAYPIAGLHWLHGWEYGVVFGLVTCAFARYWQRLANCPDENSQLAAVARAKSLATVQAIAIVSTMLWLVASGKLRTIKGDWLANDVFLASGCAMLALSVLLVTALRQSEA